MRRSSIHLVILGGAALALLPAAAQSSGGEDLFTPPAAEALLFSFSDRPAEGPSPGALPVPQPLNHRGLEAPGERHLRHDGSLAGQGLPGGRGRSLSLGMVLGSRYPTAFDRYVEEIETRIRQARRRLDG